MYYPFSAIVGQKLMKKALILNAINPKLGGVLIRGEKGTAKSTAVRALAELLPEIRVVEGCPFGCDPDNPAQMCTNCREKWERGEKLPVTTRKMRVVDLPISATEDRVVGTLDIERAIKKGEKCFEPGVLAEANRGILYVDEVNLLDDHVVDILLDSAAMGVNIVEREGVSFSHPANFILVGTMNPEEGDLRPQLLDRFGLCVSVEGIDDPSARVEIIKNRLAFEEDPAKFAEKWEEKQEELRQKIFSAKQLLPHVRVDDKMLELIARISLDMGVDGHRADIVMMKTAATIAAYKGKELVEEEEVKEAAELVLPHRMRKKPFEQSQMDKEKLEQILKEQQKQQQSQPKPQNQQQQRQQEQQRQQQQQQQEVEGEDKKKTDKSVEEEEGENNNGSEEQVFEIGEEFSIKRIMFSKDKNLRRKGSGRRSLTRINSKKGRYVRSKFYNENNDIAFDATLRAAAPYQKSRKKEGVAISIKEWDIREKVREKKIGNFIVFVVDGSGSMNANQRIKAAKGAIVSLLLDAYQKRDEVAMIVFKGETAEVVLPPTSSVELAYKLMEELPTGGKTPLAEGLYKGLEVIKNAKYRNPDIYPIIVLISDGRANVSRGSKKPIEEVKEMALLIKKEEIKSIVIDVEKDNFITFGLAREIANLMDAKYFKIDDLKAEKIIDVVKQSLYV